MHDILRASRGEAEDLGKRGNDPQEHVYLRSYDLGNLPSRSSVGRFVAGRNRKGSNGRQRNLDQKANKDYANHRTTNEHR